MQRSGRDVDDQAKIKKQLLHATSQAKIFFLWQGWFYDTSHVHLMTDIDKWRALLSALL